MNSLVITAIIAIVLGIAIFIFPQGLNYLIALYLIAIGITGLITARKQ